MGGQPVRRLEGRYKSINSTESISQDSNSKLTYRLDSDLDATQELQIVGKKSTTFVQIEENGFLLSIMDIHCFLCVSLVSFCVFLVKLLFAPLIMYTVEKE